MHGILLCFSLALAGARERPAGVDVRSDVLYRTVGGVELALDAYLPAGEGPHPGVFLVHGGAWIGGKKEDMREFGERLAARGFACFSPAYRLAPAHRYPAQIEDCLVAVQFVRSRARDFDVDPARVGALGLSAGGHLVELLAVLDERREPGSDDPVLRESTRIACVVPYFAPSVLTRTALYDFDTQPPAGLFGADADDAAYAAGSPLTYVTKDDPPFLMVHGDADDTVPIGHSLLIAESLAKASVPCELVVIEGGGHGEFFFKDPEGEYWRRTLAFLEQHLRAPARAR